MARKILEDRYGRTFTHIQKHLNIIIPPKYFIIVLWNLNDDLQTHTPSGA